MLKKFIFSVAAIMALSLVAMAYDGDATLSGPIIDKACALSKVAKAADPQAAAEASPTSCARMESCVKSGLGLYSGGKFYQFDDKGNALAKAALEKTKKDKGAKFEVTGKVTGDKIVVEKLVELP
jgi:hypothetical protein